MQITIKNIGPIEHLSLPLPEAGVVVLRGRNGTGKSHALAAVDSLISGRGRPPCRDHARQGVVEGAGARLTIGRSMRRTGEAEVVSLEGRLDISQLVQPPIKDEESADRTRIKALIQLSGAAADPSMFAAILPPDLSISELVPPSDQSDDPVVLAGRIKRALEAEARRAEAAAESAKAKASALRDQADATPAELHGAMPVITRDQAEVELQAALVAQKEIQSAAAEAQRRREQAQKARQVLAHLRASVPSDQSADNLQAELDGLNEQIERLRRALDVALERQRQISRQLEQARTVQAQIAQLEQIVAAEPESVPDQAIVEAAERVERARAQQRLVIETEQRRRWLDQAAEAMRDAAAAEARANAIRDAAQATDEVLSTLVGRVTSRLRVEAGRLICDTERGAEPFGELSPGERWRIALEIAAEQVGRGGLVTVPQEGWEGLDPVHRAEVAQIAHQVGVVLLTAEAGDCEQIETEVL